MSACSRFRICVIAGIYMRVYVCVYVCERILFDCNWRRNICEKGGERKKGLSMV